MKQAESKPDKAREIILKDLRPVRPLAPPWRRALTVVLACVPAMAVIVWLLAGLRIDLETIGPGFSWLASLAFIGAGWALLAVLAREVTPGARVPSVYVVSGVVAVITAQVLLASTLHGSHACPVPEGSLLRVTLACFGAISLLALPVLLVTWYVFRRGVITSIWTAGLLAGVVSTVCAEAVWRLHCPFTSPGHLLLAHLPPYLPLCIVALVLLLRRRSSSGSRGGS